MANNKIFQQSRRRDKVQDVPKEDFKTSLPDPLGRSADHPKAKVKRRMPGIPKKFL